MRRTSDDVRNLDRRDNPAQRWLRSSKGDASVRSSPRLAESAAVRAIVLLGEVASVFSLIERNKAPVVEKAGTNRSKAKNETPIGGT